MSDKKQPIDVEMVRFPGNSLVVVAGKVADGVNRLKTALRTTVPEDKTN